MYLCDVDVAPVWQAKGAVEWWKQHKNTVNMEKAVRLLVQSCVLRDLQHLGQKPPLIMVSLEKDWRGKGIKNLLD